MVQTLFVLGLSHRTAPLQLREKFSIDESDVSDAAEKVRQAGFDESFVVSTCNRVEFYASGSTERVGEHALDRVMAELGAANPRQLQPHLYSHVGPAAVHHLFRVASSLDSMVVGEPQILGQLKSAYRQCKAAGLTGPTLNRAVERAISAAKRVRTDTGIGRQVVSISSVAVQLAKQIFGDLTKKNTALIGTGKMGTLAARHLLRAGVNDIFVVNRNFDKARGLASELGGHARQLSELSRLLETADIVVTSTGAGRHLIDVGMMKPIMKARKQRPIFFIDIAVPRNVDPDLNALSNVYVYDVDDLNGVAAANRAARKDEAELAESLVRKQAERFISELSSHAVKPTILALQEKVQTLKQSELDRSIARLKASQAHPEEILSQLADGLTNKLIHGVLMELKSRASEGQAQDVVETVRRMYGIDQGGSE